MQYGKTTMQDDVFSAVMIIGFIMAALILLALYLLHRFGKRDAGKGVNKKAVASKKAKKGRRK